MTFTAQNSAMRLPPGSSEELLCELKLGDGVLAIVAGSGASRLGGDVLPFIRHQVHSAQPQVSWPYRDPSARLIAWRVGPDTPLFPQSFPPAQCEPKNGHHDGHRCPSRNYGSGGSVGVLD